MNKIIVRGARTHNLKNIDLDIPRDQFVVITGKSGSGKSSLAFDTLYAEGQRRYVESLSTYARQFLSVMEKPDIEHIEGLSPAISIEQKSTSHNPRSTVGTVTEIYDYLRLLFARAGIPECPEHGIQLKSQTISQMVDQVMAFKANTKLMLLAPVIKNRKGEHVKTLNELRQKGFIRARIDGDIVELESIDRLEKNKRHTVEVVVDRFKIRDGLQLRLAESFESALQLSGGIAKIAKMGKPAGEDTDETTFSSEYACPTCGYSLPTLEPSFFSFNSPAGACPSCNGLGVKQFFDEKRIVNNPELSLAEGAIKGWDQRSHYYFQLLSAVAEHYGFELDVPFETLALDTQQLVLYGSGDEAISISYQTSRGDTYNKTQSFEGVIPNLERRLRETESNSVREELAKNLSYQTCDTCEGTRLTNSARHVFIAGYSLPYLTSLTIEEAFNTLKQLPLSGSQKAIADKIIKEIITRLQFLNDVGLNYLTLNRSADTLSGGEAQRIRLASQIGAGLVGVMYILDEPSIGLHQRDNDRLLGTLLRLRDMGNTVIVVEHDEDAMRSADHIIDIGPGAGVHGGEIIAQGNLDNIIASTLSETGAYLSGTKSIDVPHERQAVSKTEKLILKGAKGNNLKSITLEIPLGLMTCITGVSGSGKSTLINGTLYPAAAIALNNALSLSPQSYQSIKGLEKLDKCINIDQSPIGRTPRSNPATYTGIFTHIRDLFAGTQESRSRGYKAGRFSFNVKGGRCEACQGDGVTRVEMHFLADVYVTCDVCQGQRYNRETLEVLYKGKNIYQVLSMTIEESKDFFDAVPQISKKLHTLMEVGLGYIQLGQSAMTLSGGEAQRVKIAKELAKRSTGNTLYILDEPTTGLHFSDIKMLLNVLQQLKAKGNSIVVIEHNLDVIKTADWVVDLGPEGGSGGGEVIAAGTPEEISRCAKSHTGQFLKKLL